MKHLRVCSLGLQAVLLCASATLGAPRWKLADEQLLKAVEVGSLAQVRAALARGADVDVRDSEMETPLIVQVAQRYSNNGRIEIIRELLRQGANAHARGVGRQTALHFAAGVGWTQAATLLLQRNAEIEARDQFGRTSLMLAASDVQANDVQARDAADLSRLRTVRLLLKHSAKVNSRSREGETALIFVAQSQAQSVSQRATASKITRLLLSRGADPNLKSNNGNTALKWARLRGHKAIVRLLKQR